MKTQLLTVAEKSSFRETGRIDEVEALCTAMEKEWPDSVHVFEYGRSAEGRSLKALIVSRSGALTAAAIRSAGTPVLMIQAGIHPGESEGKDGGFMALRDLLDAAHPREALQRIALLFVPAFNTDGHERVGRWNRPNQNGPEETGWRVTGQNLNLNRDYTKADTPEMQAMLRLVHDWDPLICADLHTTDGANFEPDVSIQVEPLHQGDGALQATGRELGDALIERLSAQGSLPLNFYPDLVRTDDPSSGFVQTVYSPRFSTGYFPQRNRFAVLVETHSWKPYAHRVGTMRNTVIDLIELTSAHGARWQELARHADDTAAALADSTMTLDFESGWRERAADTGPMPDHGGRIIEFRGYAYQRKQSEVSGDLVTVYDPKTPQVWRVPLRDEVRPSVTARAPKVGYVVDAAFAEPIAGKLALHRVTFERLGHAREAAVEVFRADSVTFSPAPFEGRMRATWAGSWRTERRRIESGSIFVTIAQPLARLVMALLEPQAPDSFAAWGFFNACCEQKEFMEPYVAEMVAQQLLASDPALKAEFQSKLKSDAAFRHNPQARLEFFLRRHPSWDERYNLYPVWRLEERL